jgi:serine/threonine protein kinase
MGINPMMVKICDIGSCRVITNEATEWATLVETVPFFAPEIIHNYMSTGHCNNQFQSDVFSLGLCLLYLITFKKFKINERLKVEERIHIEIISVWTK